MLRLLFNAEAIALLIKLSHTISLWVAYSITEDGGFVILFSINYCLMQLRSAEHSPSPTSDFPLSIGAATPSSSQPVPQATS